MKSVWGWENCKDRLKRYAQVSPKCKLEALEQMRLFVSKYSVVKRQQKQQTVA
jgi:hypothetical protein